jgi:hypothetical protein
MLKKIKYFDNKISYTFDVIDVNKKQIVSVLSREPGHLPLPLSPPPENFFALSEEKIWIKHCK